MVLYLAFYTRVYPFEFKFTSLWRNTHRSFLNVHLPWCFYQSINKLLQSLQECRTLWLRVQHQTPSLWCGIHLKSWEISSHTRSTMKKIQSQKCTWLCRHQKTHSPLKTCPKEPPTSLRFLLSQITAKEWEAYPLKERHRDSVSGFYLLPIFRNIFQEKRWMFTDTDVSGSFTRYLLHVFTIIWYRNLFVEDFYAFLCSLLSVFFLLSSSFTYFFPFLLRRTNVKSVLICVTI